MITVFKSILSLCLVCCSIGAFAQQWKQNLNSNSTFFEIQKAFNDYYAGKQAPRNEFDNKEDGEYMHYKRWEYFVKNRLNNKGQFATQQLFQEYNKNKTLKTNATPNTSANWHYIGPTNVPLDGGGAGRINTLEFHPTNTSTMWIGAANGGLWKTTNGGASWTSNTDFLPNLSVADIAINPQNPNEMYVATGDNSGYESGISFWGGTYTSGLLKSTDAGSTWSTTGLTYVMTDLNVIHKIQLLPNSPQTVLVGHRNGIERTTDGGATWTSVSFNRVYDFELEPLNPNTIYAVGDGYLYKSTNSGLTWASTNIVSSSGRMSIAISASNPSKIYVLNKNGNLYASTNSGTSFSFIKDVPNSSGISLYGYYDCVLAVSPTNANEVYVAGLDVAKSLDGGISWQIKGDWANYQNPDYLHADNHYIEFLPNSSSTLFSCNDGGIFKSIDNATTWTDISSNLQIAQYYRIGTAQSSPSHYYLGQQDNGTVLASAGTFSVMLTGDGMESVVDKNNPDRAIISYQNGNFYQTTDNWVNYIDITISSAVGGWTTPLQIDPQDQNIIYAGYDELYKSLDFGATWNPISSFGNSNEIEYFVVSPSNSNDIYVANDNLLYYTHNGGTTWSSSTSGLPTTGFNGITFITVSNTDANKVWVTYNGYDIGNKVYMSNDGGLTWTNFSGSLPNIPCNTIVYQPNSNDELYLGTDFGVYYRNNTMTDWIPFQTNLPNVIINELEIVPSLNTIRAATYGRGVWESALNNPIAAGLNENNTSSEFISLYPNPAENSLTINFTNTSKLRTVILTNLLGEEVYTETISKMNNTLDIEGLTSGVYMVSVFENKQTVATQKIVKL